MPVTGTQRGVASPARSADIRLCCETQFPRQHDRPPCRRAAGTQLPPLLRRVHDLAAWHLDVGRGGGVRRAGQRRDGAGLGYVFAAGIVPQVIFMLGGGVIADRFGRRRAMLAADAVRCCAQAALAAALFLGHPRIWVFVLLAGLGGTGDAFFEPALSGLTVEIASSGQRANANALLSVANSAARVAGPALAGILVAAAGPAVVIACDAASYGASVFALGLLRLPGAARRSGRSPLADLAEGWAEFGSRAWLVITTVQFTLFNLLTWGPFLVLGPVVSKAYLGGAGGWGPVMPALGGGSILGGLLALGRRPRRPVAAATASTFGYAVPGALLALHAPVAAVAAGALVAGLGSGLRHGLHA